MKDALGHGSDAQNGAAADALAGNHPKSVGVPVHPGTLPQPGSQAWLTAKAGGPAWAWKDAAGVPRQGFMEKTVDRGGTDVSHFMRRNPGGELDIVSGSRAKEMKTIPSGNTIRTPSGHNYNADAVNNAIASSNRSGRRIGGREAKLIHALLRG